jgi:hypothetical protein
MTDQHTFNISGCGPPSTPAPTPAVVTFGEMVAQVKSPPTFLPVDRLLITCADGHVKMSQPRSSNDIALLRPSIQGGLGYITHMAWGAKNPIPRHRSRLFG